MSGLACESRVLANIRAAAAAIPAMTGLALEGVWLAGSYAAETASEHSDVDLYAVTKHDVGWRKYFRSGELDVDLFLISEGRVRQAIVERRAPLITIFASSVVLDDRHGLMAELLAAAQARVLDGPAPVSLAALSLQRHRLDTILTDLEDCDETSGCVLIASVLVELAELQLQSTGRWGVEHRRLIATLAAGDPAVGRWFATVASGRTAYAERLQTFRVLVEHVLKPIGGRLRYFETARTWRTEELPDRTPAR